MIIDDMSFATAAGWLSPPSPRADLLLCFGARSAMERRVARCRRYPDARV
jgi:hypothetical protein